MKKEVKHEDMVKKAYLEDYTKLKKIGDGGYASVYKVRHNQLEYIRAVRVLKENVDSEDDEIFQKFLEECKRLLRLGNGNHPNIVHIYQPLWKDGKAFVEMDYITGENVSQYIEREKFIPIEEVIKFAEEIGSALAYCHVDIYKYCYDRERDKLEDDPNDGSKPLIDDKTKKRLINKYQVIHNDIHPGNIMRRDDGHYILLDFGLSIQNGEVLRKSQRMNGVPEYKSPEKWDNDSELSTQSDIYSFGIVLYEMLTGHVPFAYNKELSSTKADYELLNAHKKTPPPSVVKEREKAYKKTHLDNNYLNDIPKWLEDVVKKCLAKDPNERYENGRILYDYVEYEIARSKANKTNDDDGKGTVKKSEGYYLLSRKKYLEAKRFFATIEKNPAMAAICTELISLERKLRNRYISDAEKKHLDELYKKYNIY